MIGKIVSINKKSITVETNWTGYVINVPEPQKFEANKVKKIYLYKHSGIGNKNYLTEEMYGFDNYESKEFFMQLINISGIGPKTALGICANDIKTLKQLIINKDMESLNSLNNITNKFARLMVDNLHDIYKLSGTNEGETPTDIANLVKALKSLGYSSKDVEFAMKNMDFSNNDIELSDLISQAIKIIATQQPINNVHTNIKTN
jgi:Holliday junction DNA helicase RuvA